MDFFEKKKKELCYVWLEVKVDYIIKFVVVKVRLFFKIFIKYNC